MELIRDVYKYQLEEDFTYEHPLLKNLSVDQEWMSIQDGKITVKKGYAWNGCSPNKIILGLWKVGTPNGAMRHGKAWTYYASLVHDALTQYRASINITREDSIVIFGDILTEAKWPLTGLYTLALRLFFTAVFLGDK